MTCGCVDVGVVNVGMMDVGVVNVGVLIHVWVFRVYILLL